MAGLGVDIHTFNILSLCSGDAGLDLGFNLAIPSARTVCFVEIEAACCEVLATRMEEGCLAPAPIWTDLKCFDGKPWRGVVDCIIGGYPCQPFSIAGRKLGEEDPRHLFPHIARIIREVEPTYCFFENVSNHLNVGFDSVRGELQGLGYLVEAGLFSAEEVGAPHKRERLFILAYSNQRGKQQQKHVEATEPRSNEGDSPERGGLRLVESKLADSSSERRQQEPGSPSSNEEEDGGTGRNWIESYSSNILAGNGNELADAGSEGLEIGGGRREDASALRQASGAIAFGESAPFPPGPADLESWRDILACRPDLAPAISEEEAQAQSEIRGVAYGLDSRVDQLRAVGNGVVPLVAAYALVILIAAIRARCLRESEEEQLAA